MNVMNEDLWLPPPDSPLPPPTFHLHSHSQLQKVRLSYITLRETHNPQGLGLRGLKLGHAHVCLCGQWIIQMYDESLIPWGSVKPNPTHLVVALDNITKKMLYFFRRGCDTSQPLKKDESFSMRMGIANILLLCSQRLTRSGNLSQP